MSDKRNINKPVQLSFKKDISIDYLINFDINLQPGVAKKIKQIVHVFNDSGYNAKCISIKKSHFQDHFFILKEIWASKSNILILRNAMYFMPIIAPFLLVKRLMGQYIIIDMPSPIITALDEIRMQEFSSLSKIIRLLVVIFSFPWVLYPANKVLQYSHESSYFLFGLRKKNKLIANGIDVSSISIQKTIPQWPANKLIMIGVASLASWHGFDRVIRGLADYYKKKTTNMKKVEFLIVGDGTIRSEWEQLVKSLKLSDHIKFLGSLTGSKLNESFENTHIGISSIGAHRIGLSLLSSLKSREYAARGIPFLSSAQDPDFSDQTEFVLNVENDNSPIVIADVVNWYSEISRKKIPGALIRNYAEENLDFHVKIKTILAGVS